MSKQAIKSILLMTYFIVITVLAISIINGCAEVAKPQRCLVTMTDALRSDYAALGQLRSPCVM